MSRGGACVPSKSRLSFMYADQQRAATSQLTLFLGTANQSGPKRSALSRPSLQPAEPTPANPKASWFASTRPPSAAFRQGRTTCTNSDKSIRANCRTMIGTAFSRDSTLSPASTIAFASLVLGARLVIFYCAPTYGSACFVGGVLPSMARDC